MQVKIKSFNVDMEVKTSGIEFEVRQSDGQAQIGDCYITKTGLIWCNGRTTKDNGIRLSWDEFMVIMSSDASKAAAIAAARG